jgi:hypothetical protein
MFGRKLDAEVLLARRELQLLERTLKQHALPNDQHQRGIAAFRQR